MAESQTIARPYAEAAFKWARDHDALPAWSDALDRMAGVVTAAGSYDLIGNPNLTSQQIAGVVADTAGSLTDEQRNFLMMLVENDRLGVLPAIAEAYRHLRHEQEQVLEAEVTSAFPVTDEQAAEIRATLESKYGRKVDISTLVDPELIGGVSIRVGDEVIDASVRGKLAQLSTALNAQ